MEKRAGEEVAITINMKYYSIRVYNPVLRLLGNPKYIQFMVDPVKMILGLRGIAHIEVETPLNPIFEVEQSQLEKYYCFQIKSKYFLQTLCRDMVGMKDGRVYRLSGSVNPAEGIAYFPLLDVPRRNEVMGNGGNNAVALAYRA